MMMREAHEKVIRDFGQQWTTYTDNSGYYGSIDLFREIVEPLVSVEEFAGKQIAEIGAGTGRISAMMLEAGAANVTAIEPSDAIDVLRKNLQRYGDRVKPVRAAGEKTPNGAFDIIVSIGVLHHIPDPVPTAEAAFRALRPGGKMVVWLYGKEGNAAYLAFVLPLRALTKRMPHRVNAALAWALDVPLVGYIAACKSLPVRLPLREYMLGYLDKLVSDKRRLVIYDQLNPEWAKYYTREEAYDLLAAAGFQDIRLHHRGGYSWTVVGTKPVGGAAV